MAEPGVCGLVLWRSFTGHSRTWSWFGSAICLHHHFVPCRKGMQGCSLEAYRNDSSGFLRAKLSSLARNGCWWWGGHRAVFSGYTVESVAWVTYREQGHSFLSVLSPPERSRRWGNLACSLLHSLVILPSPLSFAVMERRSLESLL